MAHAEQYQALPSSREDLAKRLKAVDISPQAVSRIVAEARPALVLKSSVTDDRSIPVGASKMGGLPDLPATMPWPMRPPYEGAEDLAKRFEDEAAERYADAGIFPPWMAEADGRALVERRRRILSEAREGTLRIMKEAGLEVDPAVLAAPTPDPEELKASAADNRAMADAVVKPFPLAFVGQFDLAALSREQGFDPSLPRTGRLLLFYDLWLLPASYEPRSRAGFRLIHDETPVGDLRRSEPPQELRDGPAAARSRLGSAAIAPTSVVTTIPTGDASWDTLGLAETDDGSNYGEWIFTLGWPTAQGGDNHQLGGWPRAIQSGMQSMSQLAANGVAAGTSEAWRAPEAKRLLADAEDWRLVLQIGKDEAIGQTLPGALYVLMREPDLKERRFDKAWIVYEQD